MILDTTVLIDIMRRKTSALAKVKSLEDNGEPLLVTTISIFELYSGMARSEKPSKEREKFSSVLNSQIICELDQKSAQHAGKIHGYLIKQGVMIESQDCMIAGIAKQRKETILTRNTKHFERIPGIKIETY